MHTGSNPCIRAISQHSWTRWLGGAYDMLLLFRASEELARKAGSITFAACSSRGSLRDCMEAAGDTASDRIYLLAVGRARTPAALAAHKATAALLAGSMNAFRKREVAYPPDGSTTSSVHLTTSRWLLAVGIIDDEAAQSAPPLLDVAVTIARLESASASTAAQSHRRSTRRPTDSNPCCIAEMAEAPVRCLTSCRSRAITAKTVAVRGIESSDRDGLQPCELSRFKRIVT